MVPEKLVAPECESSCPCRTAKHEPVLYGPSTVGGPAQESLGDLLKQFDKMASERRTVAKQRAARPQCSENVGTGTKIHQCTLAAKPGTLYCGRHQKQNVPDDFEATPQLADRPDNFTW